MLPYATRPLHVHVHVHAYRVFCCGTQARLGLGPLRARTRARYCRGSEDRPLV